MTAATAAPTTTTTSAAPANPAVTLTVEGATSVRASTQSPFTAVLSDGSAAVVKWSVNGEEGGDRSIGTINSSGQFTAPDVLPATPAVTVKATQIASPGLSASVNVQLLNPVPVVLGVSAVAQTASVTLTITGDKFASGAVGIVREAAVSGGTLTAPNTITLVVPATAVPPGTAAHVAVRNPDPGAVESQDFLFIMPAPAPPPPTTPSPQLPAVPFDYVAYAVTNLPPHYKDPTSPAGDLADTDNTPATNPITNAGATLGRVLFYDKLLSANNTIACGSCHQQAFGFADPKPSSTGLQGAQTARKSMGLSNAKFYQRGHFFSDERAITLEAQVLQPIQNPTEMGMTLDALIPKLSATSYYPGLFQAAFGTPDVTADRISLAVAQFVRSMVSYQSKFDQAFAAGTNGNPNFAAVFNDSEQRGQALFTNLGCTQCHGTGGHISFTVQNNGLHAVTTDPGAGSGAFKAPSLRNVAVRVWYMHDGSFNGLDLVVEFYNSGVQDNPNLSPLLRNADGTVRRLNLSAQDKIDLLNFLNTLTDPVFLKDPKFANPFSQ